MLLLIIEVIVFIAILAWFWIIPKQLLKRRAKVVDEGEFTRLMENSQLIDPRDPNEFRAKHIIGARNIPYAQIDESMNAIMKSKPVLMYENAKPSAITSKMAAKMKKAGVPEIYLLKEGLNSWTGRIKTNK